MEGQKEKRATIEVCPECKVREGDSSKKRLYKCRYCGRYFCKKHLSTRLALIRNAVEEINDPVLKDKVYEEWRKPNGHPDWIWTKQYFLKFEREEKERKEKIFEVLDSWKRPVEMQEKSPSEKSVYIPPKPDYVFSSFKESNNWKHKRKSISISKIIAIVFLLFIGFLFYVNKESILNLLKEKPSDVQSSLSLVENPERQISIPSITSRETSIEDIIKNSEKYAGEEVEIEGVVDFWIPLEDCCVTIVKDRTLNYILKVKNFCFEKIKVKDWAEYYTCNEPRYCTQLHIFTLKGNLTIEKIGRPILNVSSFKFKECMSIY